jgi:hypothetical protein
MTGGNFVGALHQGLDGFPESAQQQDARREAEQRSER